MVISKPQRAIEPAWVITPRRRALNTSA